MKCPKCGTELVVFELQVVEPEPKKPRPWQVGDWAIRNDCSERAMEFGTAPRQVTAFDQYGYLRFAGIQGYYINPNEYIRVLSERGTPDPEQPES
jgi:hypothetical protein